MRVGSLFSGVGLGDFGLMLAGMEIAWQVEIDGFCNEILELRWPGIPRWRDVKTVHGIAAHAASRRRTKAREHDGGRISLSARFGERSRVSANDPQHGRRSRWQGRSDPANTGQQQSALCSNCLPAVDLIIGGPPCQPFSLAGKRAGTSDDRYLWPEMARIVRDVGPRWVVFENVPGVEKVVESVVVPDLESLSYECWWLEIPAQALEACHRRMRVWVIAYREERTRGDRQIAAAGEAQQPARGFRGDAADSASGRCQASAECDGEQAQGTTDGNSCGRDADGPVAADASQGGLQRSRGQQGNGQRSGQVDPAKRSGCEHESFNNSDSQWHRPPPEPTIRGVDAKSARCVDRLKSLGNGMDVRGVYEIGRMIMRYEDR